MIIDCKEEWKKAPYFYVVYVTEDEVVNFDESEGRKILIDIGNQLDEAHGGAAVDFIATEDLDWIDPKNRIKIILCEETARNLVLNLEKALSMIR